VRYTKSMRIWRGVFVAALFAVVSNFVVMGTTAHAAGPNDAFSLQVSPSPLVQTVKPGVATTVPLQVRNNGTGTEKLKVEVRRFTYNSQNGQISIDDIAAGDLSQWITFSEPRFTVAPGQVFTQNVKLNFPAESGFSYSFVLIISRQDQTQATGGGRLLEGSIADFGLVNIDRPGATRGLEISSLKASAGVYEYAPATLSVTYKNTGNTFVQPLGNIFISRGDANDPITTLSANDAGGFLLPNTSRTINAQWNDAFPRLETETLSDGTVKTHEVWNWADIGKFRFGLYTASVVAIYNNGAFDIPLNAEVQFWIIPWKILLGALIVLLVVVFGIVTVVRAIVRSVSGDRRNGFRR